MPNTGDAVTGRKQLLVSAFKDAKHSKEKTVGKLVHLKMSNTGEATAGRNQLLVSAFKDA